jgi:hypothetical protein
MYTMNYNGYQNSLVNKFGPQFNVLTIPTTYIVVLVTETAMW